MPDPPAHRMSAIREGRKEVRTEQRTRELVADLTEQFALRERRLRTSQRRGGPVRRGRAVVELMVTAHLTFYTGFYRRTVSPLLSRRYNTRRAAWAEGGHAPVFHMRFPG